MCEDTHDEHVDFRVMGALISGHLIITDPEQPFGPMAPSWYDNELLHLASDLGSRLLPAFDATGTGIPYPRVRLSCQLISYEIHETFSSVTSYFMEKNNF